MIGSPTPAQLQNVVVVNRLSEARLGLEQMASQQAAAIGQERVEVLLAAAREVDAQMVAACEPLLASVSDSVEAILLTMYAQGGLQWRGRGCHKSGTTLLALYEGAPSMLTKF